MLNKEMISSSIPSLKLTDSVFQAMELMAEFYVKQLPVVAGDKYVGLVYEDDLMNLEDTAELESVSTHFSKVSVHGNMHFLDAVQTANDYHLTVVPVVEKDSDFIGIIVIGDLLRQLGKITGASEPGGVLVLEMDQRNFSFADRSHSSILPGTTAPIPSSSRSRSTSLKFPISWLPFSDTTTR